MKLRGINLILLLLLAVLIARLWLMPLRSSFWVDETVTAFVVRYGAAHPSLAVAPQVAESVYYALARGAVALFGWSEAAFRLPSLLAMAAALFLIVRLAARLIHPDAGWFAAFACLSLRGFNYQAADARPYGLGTCVLAASLWFLVRWLDTARWRDAALFVLCGALLWRVHLLFWPLYIVMVLYAALRLARGETAVSRIRAGAVFAALGLTLVPVALDALALLPHAQAHVIVPAPTLRNLGYSLKPGLVAVCGLGTWLLVRLSKPKRAQAISPAPSALVLIVGWWLCDPLCLFAFSRLTGESVFLPRYLSVALPGASLAATAAASLFMPAASWKRLSALLGVGVLLLLGQWRVPWPRHDQSDWRGAVQRLDGLHLRAGTPVICPSPFIEAMPPNWRPDYPLPGFLYAHLAYYPVPGKPYLFPFEDSPEAERYAATLAHDTLETAGRFVIYGSDRKVRFWRDWFAGQPEFAGWRHQDLGSFGDVEAVLFESRR